jgi:hypothetical protein
MNLMATTFAGATAAFTISLVVSFWARPQDPWQEALRTITRLPPKAFTSLPAPVRAALERRKCFIPQSKEYPEPHNVIKGHFRSARQLDWAVLCSRNDSSQVFVFWAGRANRIDSLGPTSDMGYLQGLGPQGIGYSRVISAATPEQILEYAREFDGPIPPQPIHDGIEDAFVGKASWIAYFTGKKWISLAGAD